ncbi:putative Cell division control protein 45 CDC45 [Zostera marina]|uniref:Putative Cell division control protein 45 CDC45 n=1 Tax=Zostera marina TaxID=29655 RepID=A0A0K9NPK8_ZOSMR|nr:putative Cell division control protein 45 CDC45 [Zostera marina]
MVREERVEFFYKSLRNAVAASTPYPLKIFPSTSDADSICTLKIITQILNSDSIRTYSIYPVSSFSDLEKHVPTDVLSSDQNFTLLFINWGCHRDLRRVLGLGAGARVFVVDSHRPIHLHNLSNHNERVVVLYTQDDEQQADLAYDFHISSLANASDLNSDDEFDENSESDSDSDSDDDRSPGNRKRRRISEGSEDDPARIFRKLKAEYYKLGTFHGKPSGCLIHDLAHTLRKNTDEMLWLACVSLTDQFVHERLTNERYHSGVMELEQHINSSGNLDTISSVTLKDGTRIAAPDNSISYEDEPRLMLLREWNLFESMLCSSYVATKLKTWSDNGLKKLKLLLARMGFALIDCQKKFQYMSTEVKQKMKDEFERFLPEYGLTEFYYRSFLRAHGYRSKLSAADVVYGITALLESSVGTKDTDLPESFLGTEDTVLLQSSVGTEDTSSCAQFWVAYHALSLNHLDELRKGMESAIEIQRAIVRQGSSAITKTGFIKSRRKFRWLKLEDSVDTDWLAHPQSLTKFCSFLMDALKERGARMKPLICACLIKEPDNSKVLIVGVCGKPRLGAIQGNAFGIAFRTAAEEIGAEYFHELFESSWIILDTAAISSFMIRLTDKL